MTLTAALPYHGKRILICPLDWGLGHAARCVPLIKNLLAQHNQIIIGCMEWQRKFFEGEVDGVEYADLFGYDVSYSKVLPIVLKMLVQYPRLKTVVKKEHEWLRDFTKKKKIDVVISDNRYGLYNEKIESIFITHQLFIPTPFLKSKVNESNHRYINSFDECWVPDYPDEKNCLSGALSHPPQGISHLKFIGPLSRFSRGARAIDKKFDVLVLLSGVEPQRTLLEDKLTESLANPPLRIALVRGSTSTSEKYFPKNFTVTSVANTTQLEDLLLSSEKVICRSGYSTLMDLHALDKKALLIPTPGQSEQEYLAKYWKEKFDYNVITQSRINAEAIMAALDLKENLPLQKKSV